MLKYIIACGCGRERAAAPTLADARTAARAAGWSHPSRGVDRCPVCAEAKRQHDAANPGNGYF
jgi:hypothetical protein